MKPNYLELCSITPPQENKLPAVIETVFTLPIKKQWLYLQAAQNLGLPATIVDPCRIQITATARQFVTFYDELKRLETHLVQPHCLLTAQEKPDLDEPNYAVAIACLMAM